MHADPQPQGVKIARRNTCRLRNATKAVPIDAAVIRDQQATADLYADAGVIQKRFDVAGYFDASFNAALTN